VEVSTRDKHFLKGFGIKKENTLQISTFVPSIGLESGSGIWTLVYQKW